MGFHTSLCSTLALALAANPAQEASGLGRRRGGHHTLLYDRKVIPGNPDSPELSFTSLLDLMTFSTLVKLGSRHLTAAVFRDFYRTDQCGCCRAFKDCDVNVKQTSNSKSRYKIFIREWEIYFAPSQLSFLPFLLSPADGAISDEKLNCAAPLIILLARATEWKHRAGIWLHERGFPSSYINNWIIHQVLQLQNKIHTQGQV